MRFQFILATGFFLEIITLLNNIVQLALKFVY